MRVISEDGAYSGTEMVNAVTGPGPSLGGGGQRRQLGSGDGGRVTRRKFYLKIIVQRQLLCHL